jgi:hypothetical protein
LGLYTTKKVFHTIGQPAERCEVPTRGADIPKGLIVEGDMLGLIPTLKYANHDITNENKFPDLVPRKVLKKYIIFETQMIVIKPHI